MRSLSAGAVHAAVLLLMLCGAACAAAPLDIWLDVPFVKQQKDGCGPASIAMVMQYWKKQQHAAPNPAAGAPQIIRALKPRQNHGVRASNMVRYFRQHGYQAIPYAGDWADLKHQLENGRPLIAALKPGSGSELHYVVVAGIDDPEQLVLLNDPAQRKLLKEDRGQFEREWKATGFWTLLAVPTLKPH